MRALSLFIKTSIIEALYSAITGITNMTEAFGKVKIKGAHKDKNYVAKATDTDIMKASVLAYIEAINSVIVDTLAAPV